MAAFFTVDELEAHLRVTVSDTDAAEQYADSASGIIRDYLGQRIDRVRNDTAVVVGDGSELLMLPEMPVTAVSAVSVGGSALSVGEWSFGPKGQLWRYVSASEVLSWVAKWPKGVPVTVTYDHGYVAVPAAVKAVALELAAGLYQNPAGVVSEAVGQYSVTYGSSSAGGGATGRMGLRQDQMMRLLPYRSPNI